MCGIVGNMDSCADRHRCYVPRMFAFGSPGAAAAPQFVPNDAAQAWISAALGRLRERLGPPAQSDRLITCPTTLSSPHDLDDVFELICGLQEQVGQEDVEFTLLPADQQARLDDQFVPLGDPTGQLMHSFHHKRDDSYLMLFSEASFRVLPVLYASIARELGRFALHRSGTALFSADDEFEPDTESEAELAAVTLGMGLWVANGAVMFENGCCGGGCGVDLRSLRAGLSVPEVGHALAVDARARGVGKWSISRHLESTQKAAFKRNWSVVKRGTSTATLGPASSRGQLEG